jgi:hypothetical protein
MKAKQRASTDSPPSVAEMDKVQAPPPADAAAADAARKAEYEQAEADKAAAAAAADSLGQRHRHKKPAAHDEGEVANAAAQKQKQAAESEAKAKEEEAAAAAAEKPAGKEKPASTRNKRQSSKSADARKSSKETETSAPPPAEAPASPEKTPGDNSLSRSRQASRQTSRQSSKLRGSKGASPASARPAQADRYEPETTPGEGDAAITTPKSTTAAAAAAGGGPVELPLKERVKLSNGGLGTVASSSGGTYVVILDDGKKVNCKRKDLSVNKEKAPLKALYHFLTHFFLTKEKRKEGWVEKDEGGLVTKRVALQSTTSKKGSDPKGTVIAFHPTNNSYFVCLDNGDVVFARKRNLTLVDDNDAIPPGALAIRKTPPPSTRGRKKTPSPRTASADDARGGNGGGGGIKKSPSRSSSPYAFNRCRMPLV